jgi:transposase
MSKFGPFTDGRTFASGDVAKESIVFYIDSIDTHIECKNELKDLRELAKTLVKHKPKLIVLEATGGYERKARSVFAEFNLPSTTIIPKRARYFAKSMGLEAKNDRIDAETLAYFGRVAEKKLPPSTIASDEQSQLRALVQRRQQLIEMRIADENRLDTAHPSMLREIQKDVDYIKRRIKRIEVELAKRIQANPQWNQKDEILRSFKGVGEKSSFTLLTELPELGTVDGKKIAALVGVAPYAKDSGPKTGPRHIRGGRNSIRRILFMATMTAIRRNPIIKEHYKQLCERGKPKKSALIACVRKIIVILNAMIANLSRWSPPLVNQT